MTTVMMRLMLIRRMSNPPPAWAGDLDSTYTCFVCSPTPSSVTPAPSSVIPAKAGTQSYFNITSLPICVRVSDSTTQ
jgi:hypothetical protein